MVGQTIGLLMAKAAEAHHLDRVVVIGHLTDLPSMRRVLSQFGPFFHGEVVIPDGAGWGTAIGALTRLKGDGSGAPNLAP